MSRRRIGVTPLWRYGCNTGTMCTKGNMVILDLDVGVVYKEEAEQLYLQPSSSITPSFENHSDKAINSSNGQLHNPPIPPRRRARRPRCSLDHQNRAHASPRTRRDPDQGASLWCLLYRHPHPGRQLWHARLPANPWSRDHRDCGGCRWRRPGSLEGRRSCGWSLPWRALWGVQELREGNEHLL